VLGHREALTKIVDGDAEFHRVPDVFYRAAAGCAEPVLRLDDGGPWWCCSFAAATEVLDRSAVFGMGGTLATRTTPGDLAQHWLELVDGESHRLQRRVVQVAMSEVALAASLDRTLGGLDLPASCDVMKDLAEPFWRRFQADWLGLAEPHLTELVERIPALLAVVMDLERGPEDEQTAAEAAATLARLIGDGCGTGGVIGALVALGLSPTQVAAHVVNLVVDMSVIPAGLGICLTRIIDDPQARRDAAVADRLPLVIDECLRLDPPQLLLVRNAIAAVELGGHTICPDDQVIVVVGMANRDAGFFPDPHAYRLRRRTALSFGLGRHSCLGRRTFGLVAEALVGSLLRRNPGLHRAGESAHATQVGIRSIEALPVRLAAA